MSAPDLGPLEATLVSQALASTILCFGPMLERFERQLAEFAGAKHAAALSSGTSALHACVVAAGIGDGDEVITTPFSFVASSNCLLFERALPCFVDVDPRTGNLDPALIEQRITPRTKAILPVHVFGQPVDMDPVTEIARRRGLVVIEDACEAIGAEYKGRSAGTLGDAGVFAFYPNKQITTGEGGAIVTNREDWDHLFRSLRNQGRDVMDPWLVHSRLGFNYRLGELAAALGVAQMERLPELLAKRERVAALYAERLAGIDRVSIPLIVDTTSRMSWFVYVVRLDHSLNRDDVMRRLAADGVPTRPYFSAIHLQPFYRRRFGFSEGDFPVTEDLAARSMALPFHGNLSEADIEYVCDRLIAYTR
ncbi:MAG: DegT/DnrJ/EryC1/StrS family aminotransferase [Acidobacteriota bacterium]|nr:DegT/DnrJ/EryC1/StrS family aminotransferase [Acidobacteriota bacterium]